MYFRMKKIQANKKKQKELELAERGAEKVSITELLCLKFSYRGRQKKQPKIISNEIFFKTRKSSLFSSIRIADSAVLRIPKIFVNITPSTSLNIPPDRICDQTFDNIL